MQRALSLPVALSIFFACAVLAQTQETKPPASPRVIDVFNRLSHMTGDPEKESAWIAHAIGLSPDGTELLLRIMSVYRKEFDAIVKTYNDAASEAREKAGHPPDPSVVATFKTQRRELASHISQPRIPPLFG